MAATKSRSASGVLDRIVEPKRPTLTPAAAKSILELHFPPSDVTRMNELAEKARQGTLNDAEQTDMDEYERVGLFLSLMKSKARISLRSVKSA